MELEKQVYKIIKAKNWQALPATPLNDVREKLNGLSHGPEYDFRCKTAPQDFETITRIPCGIVFVRPLLRERKIFEKKRYGRKHVSSRLPKFQPKRTKVTQKIGFFVNPVLALSQKLRYLECRI